MEPIQFNLFVGWACMTAGAAAGAAIGVFFHDEGWMGGYGSFRRRLVRLGHIAFFGLGMINVLFALSLTAFPAPQPYTYFASGALAIGALSMPACCLLAAWRPGLRYLFPLPVLSILGGLGSVLAGWVYA
jgi:hypothetical protein